MKSRHRGGWGREGGLNSLQLDSGEQVELHIKSGNDGRGQTVGEGRGEAAIKNRRSQRFQIIIKEMNDGCWLITAKMTQFMPVKP